ncbi:MAG: nucleotide exchange factor GrpE [Flavobacteriaceae bacterium]|nr:nucleotide exchange factor GrpE [Flavobacteriaceae bacterium]
MAKKTVNKKQSKSKSNTNKVENQINDLKTELKEEEDKYLRLFAEFENYKKRTTKERIELYKTAGQEVIGSLLPVLDDFSRAIKESKKMKNSSDFIGLELIYNKLNDILKTNGLLDLEVHKGDSFDPDLHEAISQIKTDKKDSGKIIDIIEKGYKLGDKIIRFPKVVVGQ